MRRQIPLLALAIYAGLTLGLPNLAQAATEPFGSRTPAQILSLTRIAMEKAGSVHVVNKTSLNGTISFTLTTDSSTSRGAQTQVFGAGVEKVRLIGSTLFINADSAAFSLDFNVSNSTLTNEWVRVPASNPNYANISAAILLPSLIKDTLSMKSLKDLGMRIFNGRTTVAIEGFPPNSTPGTSVVQTLYIATSPPYLPVGLSTVFLEGVNGQGQSVFSHWGEKVAVRSPASYVTATTKDFP
jgi:hypothetical protein